MKKIYRKPEATVARMSFLEHVVAYNISGSCTYHFTDAAEGYEDNHCVSGDNAHIVWETSGAHFGA